MRLSQFITALQAALKKHGDLPVFTEEDVIDRVVAHPCRDGVQRSTDGVQEEPNELVLRFSA